MSFYPLNEQKRQCYFLMTFGLEAEKGNKKFREFKIKFEITLRFSLKGEH